MQEGKQGFPSTDEKKSQKGPARTNTLGSPRATLALLVALGMIASACTGYPAARLATRGGDKVEKISTPEAGAQSGAPSPAASSPAGATQAPAPAAQKTPPSKVIARTSSGTTVTLAAGGLPKANIWPDNQDRIGLSASEIKLCMHAAFVLGTAFDNAPTDEDVYWRVVNDSGGIHGRKVSIQFTDDAYTAPGTTQALDQCSQNNPFLYLGGVGFDQAPAGRNWAESHMQPYLYNMAVEASGLKYSFSFLPSINKNGGFLGQFVGTHFNGKKVGAVYVDSDNWRAGVEEFEKELKKRGMQVSNKAPIPNNNYPDFSGIANDMKGAGIQLVNAYINALALGRFILDADKQDFHPIIVSPDGFDLVTDLVGNKPLSTHGTSGDGTDHMRNFPGIYAAWLSPAYEIGPPDIKARPSVAWYSEMQAMKSAYRKYGVKAEDRINDVDWMFWLYSKTIHQMLLDCSKDCSRNILAGLMLTGYKTAILGCNIDFGLGNGRLGGHYHNVYQSQAAGNQSFWRQIETCKSGF